MTQNVNISLHPRLATSLIGHDNAISDCLDLLSQGRLPHALLLQGPKGIGKATFAYHLIKKLFAETKDAPPSSSSKDLRDSFLIDSGTPLFKRVASLGHGDLKVVERCPDEKGKLPRDIAVQQIRNVIGFFSKKAIEGGWRIALIDSVDEMNPQASNALLKILEEPPARSLLILINHTPGKLLQTLSSRCRKIMLRPLNEEQTKSVVQLNFPSFKEAYFKKVYPFSSGSPGKTLSLLTDSNVVLIESFEKLITQMLSPSPFNPFPFLDQFFAQRGKGAEDTFAPFTYALQEWLYAFIHRGIEGTLSPQERGFFNQKNPLDWVNLYTELAILFEESSYLSYHARHVVLCALIKIKKTTNCLGK